MFPEQSETIICPFDTNETVNIQCCWQKCPATDLYTYVEMHFLTTDWCRLLQNMILCDNMEWVKVSIFIPELIFNIWADKWKPAAERLFKRAGTWRKYAYNILLLFQFFSRAGGIKQLLSKMLNMSHDGVDAYEFVSWDHKVFFKQQHSNAPGISEWFRPLIQASF